MDYYEMFSRNIGILSEEEQEKLKDSKVSIAGVGGVGGVQAVYIARAGIGKMAIADPENFQSTDINRQYGATESTMGKNKAEVMGEILKDINSHLKLEIYTDGVTAENIEEFLKGSKVAIDAIEYFAPEAKKLFFEKARENDIPVISAPIFGHRALLFEYTKDSWTYEQALGSREAIPHVMKYLWPEYLSEELALEVISRKRPAPTFGPTSAISGGMVASEAVFLILGKRQPIPVPEVRYIDTFMEVYRKVDLSK